MLGGFSATITTTETFLKCMLNTLHALSTAEKQAGR